MARSDNRKTKSRLFRFLGLIIFALILWRLDARYILVQLQGIQPGILLVAIVILVAFHLLKAFRWQYILSLHGIHHTFLTAYLVYLSGLFIGVLTPGRVGDFVKILYLKTSGVSTADATFTSFLDRAADLFFLGLCALFTTLWLGHLLNNPIIFWWVAAGLCCMGAVVLISGKWNVVAKAIVRFLPKDYGTTLSSALVKIKTQLQNYTLSKILNLTVLTIAGWLLYFTVIYVLTKSVGLAIPFISVVTFFVLSTLITFLPITIAGVGTRDAALIVLFSQLGYVSEDAVTFSILILVSYILTALFGYLAWLLKPIEMSRS